MALAVVARGTGTHNVSATSLAVVPASNLAAGSMAVLVVAADNTGGGGAYSLTTVTDTKGNTWTRRQSPLYDPGAAAAGIQGAIFETPQNGGALTTGDTITVNFSAATVAKAWALWEVTRGAGATISYVTGGVNTGSATAAPTVTTGSIASGDLVIGGCFAESGTTQTFTGDADATNGAWSTQQTNKIGSTTSGVGVTSQGKVVTATATQTYNPTLGISSDCICAWIQVHEVPAPEQHSGTLAVSGGGGVAPAATKGGATVLAVAGGGGAVSLASRTAALALVVAGGGSSSFGASSAHAGLLGVSGGGGVAPAAVANRAGGLAITGGGSILAQAVGGRQAAIGVSTGGGVTIEALAEEGGGDERFGTVAVGGGGGLALSALANREASAAVSGGGSVLLAAIAAHQLALGIAGGGGVTAAWRGAHVGALAVTGGGRVAFPSGAADWTDAYVLGDVNDIEHGARPREHLLRPLERCIVCGDAHP